MKPKRLAAVLAAVAAAAAAAVTLAGCAPPYIEALDRAAALTQHMKVVGTVPGIGLQTSDSNPRLLPAKPTAASLDALNIQSGFLVTESTGQQHVYYAYVDSSGHGQTTSSMPGLSTAGADPNYPLYQYEVAATTTTANLLIFFLSPTAPASNTAWLLAATPPSGPVATTGPVTLLTTVITGAVLIGEQVTPGVSGGPDTFTWFYTNSPGTGLYAGAPAPTLSGGATIFNVVAPALAAMPPIPTLNRALHYANGSASYLEYFQGGQWQCYNVTGAPVLLPGITHRIDALLSTGDLLSTEGGTLTLYDPAGSQVLSVPMGGLQFCYEAYVGTTPYIFFSLPIALQHNSWGFIVYAIPTSQVRGL